MDNYNYKVIYSNDDNEYVGTCLEFPSLSFLDENPVNAIIGIKDLVFDVVKDMQQNNEVVPKPITHKKYSGKFIVRIPPIVHQRLAIEAMEQNISINRLVSAKLQAI
jgi:predicted HicB family RNase H-like nuclease